MAIYEAPQPVSNNLLDSITFSVPTEVRYGLLRGSGLTDETIDDANLAYVKAEFSASDGLYEIFNRKWPGGKDGGGVLLFPYFIHHKLVLWRGRLDFAVVNKDGKPQRYISPTGFGLRMYFPKDVLEYLESTERDKVVYFTEGEKKALLLCQLGYKAVGLPGVDTGCVSGGKLREDLRYLNLQGVTVFIVLDSDARINKHALNAGRKLKAALERNGATAHIIIVPDEETSQYDKLGIDDYYVIHGEGLTRDLLENPVHLRPDEKPCLREHNLEDVAEYCVSQFREKHVSYNGAVYVNNPTENVFEREDEDLTKRKIYSIVTDAYQGIRTSTINDIRTQATWQLPRPTVEPCWLDNEDVPEGFENLTECISVKGGLLNVRSGRFLETDSRLFRTSVLNAPYDPDAPQATKYLGLLEDTFGDAELIRIFLQYFGYSLTADTSLQRMLWVIGPPGSGKSTLARLWQSILGEKQYASLKLEDLAGTFALDQCVDKALLIFPDARTHRGMSIRVIEFLCNLTGQDRMTVEGKYEKAYTALLHAKLLLMSNTPPQFNDPSGALCRRLIVLPTREPPKSRQRIDGLSEMIFAKEAAGILNLAIKGLRDLYENGLAELPARCKALIEQQRFLDSPIAAFVHEMCVVGAEWKVPRQKLYQTYKDWCEANNHHSASNQKFGADLSSLVPAFKYERYTPPGKKQTHGIFGIRLKEDWEREAGDDNSYACDRELDPLNLQGSDPDHSTLRELVAVVGE